MIDNENDSESENIDTNTDTNNGWQGGAMGNQHQPDSQNDGGAGGGGSTNTITDADAGGDGGDGGGDGGEYQVIDLGNGIKIANKGEEWKKGLQGEDGKFSAQKSLEMIANLRKKNGELGGKFSAPASYTLSDTSLMGDEYAGKAVAEIDELNEIAAYAKEQNWTNDVLNSVLDYTYDKGGVMTDAQILQENQQKLQAMWGKDFKANAKTVETFFNNLTINHPDKLPIIQGMAGSAEGADLLLWFTEIAKQGSGIPPMDSGAAALDSQILSEAELMATRTQLARAKQGSSERTELNNKINSHYTALEQKELQSKNKQQRR